MTNSVGWVGFFSVKSTFKIKMKHIITFWIFVRQTVNRTRVPAPVFSLEALGLYYKTYYDLSLRIFVIKAGVFVPGKPFQTNLMFVDKA